MLVMMMMMRSIKTSQRGASSASASATQNGRRQLGEPHKKKQKKAFPALFRPLNLVIALGKPKKNDHRPNSPVSNWSGAIEEASSHHRAARGRFRGFSLARRNEREPRMERRNEDKEEEEEEEEENGRPTTR